MKIVYIDAFAGAAGDMLLSALVDLGLDQEVILGLPDRLGLEDLEPFFSEVSYHGIRALKFDLPLPNVQKHRHLKDIREIIESSDLSNEVKAKSVEAFQKLAEAEAKIHSTSLDRVHFHEVGADDALIDIVGYFIALETLGWPNVITGQPVLGRGMTRSAHGAIPLPAPAVLEILKELPVKISDIEGETVTPTGAVLLACSAIFGTCPEMTVKRIGYGAGSRQYEERPNLLRAVMGETTGEFDRDMITVFETNIDDMNPQIYEHLFDRLYQAGALEVFITPVLTKKNRPGQMLSVLCKKSVAPEVSTVIFSETTTTGIRVRDNERYILKRRLEMVTTPYGEVPIKVISMGDREKIIPEFENCRQLAALKNVPVSEIIEAARTSYLGKG